MLGVVNSYWSQHRRGLLYQYGTSAGIIHGINRARFIWRLVIIYSAPEMGVGGKAGAVICPAY